MIYVRGPALGQGYGAAGQIGDQRFATANPSYGGSEVTGEES
jgi:hypothetical protein